MAVVLGSWACMCLLCGLTADTADDSCLGRSTVTAAVSLSCFSPSWITISALITAAVPVLSLFLFAVPAVGSEQTTECCTPSHALAQHAAVHSLNIGGLNICVFGRQAVTHACLRQASAFWPLELSGCARASALVAGAWLLGPAWLRPGHRCLLPIG